MITKLTADEKSYFSQLAAQIVSTHGKNALEVLKADPVAAVSAAHAKRVDFAAEMLAQRTDRSKMARIALTANVYANAVTKAAKETAIEHCGHVAEATFRKGMFSL